MASSAAWGQDRIPHPGQPQEVAQVKIRIEYCGM
jgi:hypothetical protein